MFPIVVGLSIVAQGLLNRSQSGATSLPSAALINALVFLLASLAYWILVRLDILRANGNHDLATYAHAPWWYFLPGLFGFIIVTVTPASLQTLGAPLTFSIIIATQLGASLIFDSLESHRTPSILALSGVTLICLGVGVLFFSKSTTH